MGETKDKMPITSKSTIFFENQNIDEAIPKYTTWGSQKASNTGIQLDEKKPNGQDHDLISPKTLTLDISQLSKQALFWKTSVDELPFVGKKK